jgi:hypothetical protein
MVEIKDADLRPLDEFPLKWRWTDSRYHQLPDDALSAIRPLTQEKASELVEYSLGFTHHAGLSESQFEDVSRRDAADYPGVAPWLSELGPAKNQTVIVSWDYKCAALVSWEVFCDYWDDFCYPASDDVTIWPPSEDWALTYLHHEEFVFGRRRAKTGSAS